MRLPARITLLLFLLSSSLESEESELPFELEWKKAFKAFNDVGGSFDLKSYTPAPVPDELNFGATELFRGIAIPSGIEHPSGIDGEAVRENLYIETFLAELWPIPANMGGPSTHGYEPDPGVIEAIVTGRPSVGSKKDSGQRILKTLEERHEKIFAVVDAEIERPLAQLVPHPLTLLDLDNPFAYTSQHNSKLIGLTQLFCQRAYAAVFAGESETAYKSILAQVRLCQLVANPGTSLIDPLVANSQFGILQSSFWLAAKHRMLDEPALRQLQKEFSSMDMIPHLEESLEVEAFTFCVGMRNVLVSGIKELGKKHGIDGSGFVEKMVENWSAPFLDLMVRFCLVPLKTRDYALFKVRNIEFETLLEAHKGDYRLFFVEFGFPVIGKVVESSVKMQAYINQAQIVCALERYFLTKKTYPDSLDLLVPEYLEAIPEDPIDKNPMRYDLTGDDRYVLYSIGWDLDDDGGVPYPRSGRAEWSGDWLWTYIPFVE